MQVLRLRRSEVCPHSSVPLLPALFNDCNWAVRHPCCNCGKELNSRKEWNRARARARERERGGGNTHTQTFKNKIQNTKTKQNKKLNKKTRELQSGFTSCALPRDDATTTGYYITGDKHHSSVFPVYLLKHARAYTLTHTHTHTYTHILGT